ncbi:hypothetical protein E4T48_00447 [Aureobasidium sp. EXF-10727]|nr:hypothetical protein E4T48_00447 [Aureobasidium sp. EXF-10727]KAI4729694.1 hypothetical protein E4T49_02500 [Aureobasidium sp. EXF-10728]
MSQDRSNLGYYSTYNGCMIYNNLMDSNDPQPGQAVYTPNWSQMPVDTTVPLAGARWSGQYYRRHEGWYEPDMLSSSDMTSETSGFDDSATPSLHRSDSGDFSEVWDQEPPSMPFSPFQPPTSSGLLNNIGSAFMPLQLPACATSNSDETAQHFEYMFGELEVNDSISSPKDSDTVFHVPAHQSPLSDPEFSVPQPCHTQPHDNPIPGRPRKVRQTRETDTNQAKRPARTNSSRARLFCEACRDSKDYSRGFRGEHELARHYAQKHTKHKKVWKCFDLSPDRLMRNCERCKTGHQYGTSYGGAEHFRRKHTGIFGKDMMELLRGKNQRWALSSNRLIEEGWLRQVFVPGDGEPSPQQEEQAITAIHTPMPLTGSSQEVISHVRMQRAHLQQPFNQQHVSMQDANLAWAQHQHPLQPYHQLHHGQQQAHHHQQQWHSGMH